MKYLAVSLACFVLALAGCQSHPPRQDSAAERSIRPGVNEAYLRPGLKVEEWVGRLEREGRETYDKRHEIVAAARLKPGQDVADIGTGTGLFVPLLAQAVGPEGTIYAVDIVPRFVEHVREKAAGAGLENVEVVLSSERSVELPPRSIDLAFLCDVYHHFEYPQSTLASIHRALRPDGEFFLVDFKREPGVTSEWSLEHVRAGMEEFISEIEAAGFEKVEQDAEMMTENYIVRFRKASQ